MKPTIPLLLGALLAIGIGSSALASDGEERQQAPQARSQASGLQGIFNPAAADQPGHGWRHYRDADAYRAVVISPQGDYYFSDGDNLRWVAQARFQRC